MKVEEMFLASSVLDVEQGGRPQKYVDVSACLKESGLQFPKKIHEETVCRIPNSKNLHVMCDEEGKLPYVLVHIYH
jgi:hypothetical protein